MRVLALETAAGRIGVALVSEEGVIAEQGYPPGEPPSLRLLEGVEEVCRQARLQLQDLDGLAVSVGPGSFTGLRVGIATAQGLAFALELPVAPVPTLEALVWNLPDAAGVLCPILDAKQGEVYAALYRREPDGRLAGLGGERVVSPRILAAELQGPVTFLGDGVGRYEAELRSLLPEAVFAPPALWHPTAAKVGTLGLALLTSGGGVGPDALKPRYLRRAEAEVRWEKRLMSRR